jgi:hypothetical protein
VFDVSISLKGKLKTHSLRALSTINLLANLMCTLTSNSRDALQQISGVVALHRARFIYKDQSKNVADNLAFPAGVRYENI